MKVRSAWLVALDAARMMHAAADAAVIELHAELQTLVPGTREYADVEREFSHQCCALNRNAVLIRTITFDYYTPGE